MRSVDSDSMPEAHARQLAQHALSFFGYSDRIIDNALDQEERGAFYILEDYGLLSTEVEETTLHDGRDWRTHYWKFREDNIRGYGKDGDESYAMTEEEELYSQLPDDVWDRF